MKNARLHSIQIFTCAIYYTVNGNYCLNNLFQAVFSSLLISN